MTAPSASVTWQPIDGGRAVEVHVSGRLSRADYDRIMPQFEELLRQTPKLAFLVFLEDFHGWEPGAAWADAKFDLLHRHQFGRIAVVGDATWERWGTRVSALVLPWDVRFFDPGDAVPARRWVSGSEPADTVT